MRSTTESCVKREEDVIILAAERGSVSVRFELVVRWLLRLDRIAGDIARLEEAGPDRDSSAVVCADVAVCCVFVVLLLFGSSDTAGSTKVAFSSSTCDDEHSFAVRSIPFESLAVELLGCSTSRIDFDPSNNTSFSCEDRFITVNWGNNCTMEQAIATANSDH